MFCAYLVRILTICLLSWVKPLMCGHNTTNNNTDTLSTNANANIDIWESETTSNVTWRTLDLSDGNQEVHLENDKLLKVAIIKLGNNGHKTVFGGGYHDHFQIDSCNGTLTGELVGGFGYNLIAVGYDCYVGKEIKLLIMKDVRILRVGSNVNIVFRGIRHVAFELLHLDFDESENWNLTFTLTGAGLLGLGKWVAFEPPEASGKVPEAWCGNYAEIGIICATWGERTLIWTTLIGFCVSFCLLICLVGLVCIPNKANTSPDFEEETMERYRSTLMKF